MLKIYAQLLMIGVLVGLTESTAWAQALQDVRVDPGIAGESTYPKVAISGSSVYVVFENNQGGNVDVYVNASADFGRTWSGPRRVDLGFGSGESVECQIAADGKRVFVVWEERSGQVPLVYFNRSFDGGLSWSTPRKLSTALASVAVNPRLAAAGSRIYVTWMDNMFGGSDWDILFTTSQNAGNTFSFPAKIDGLAPQTGVGSGEPEISVSPGTGPGGSDRVYVAWYDNRNHYLGLFTDIYVNSSADSGRTWGTPARMDTGSLPGSSDSLNPVLAASGLNVIVAWEDFRHWPNPYRSVYANYSLDGGITWASSDVRIDYAGFSGGDGALKVASNTSAFFVVYSDGDLWFDRGSISGSSATFLSSDVLLDGGAPGYSGGPAISVSGDSVAVAFSDMRNGAADIYVARSSDGGASFKVGGRLDAGSPPGSAGSWNASAAAGSYGVVAVVYQDDRGGDSDIYFNTPFEIVQYGNAYSYRHVPLEGYPDLALSAGYPRIGDSVTFEVRNGLIVAPGLGMRESGWILLGLGRANLPLGCPYLQLLVAPPYFVLPFQITEQYDPQCTLFCAGSGYSVPIAIPNDLNLVGLKVDAQAHIKDIYNNPPRCAGSAAQTQGLEITIAR